MIHLNTREQSVDGEIKVNVFGKEMNLRLKDLSYETLSGIRVNGKGEEIPIEGKGIKMTHLLKTLEVKTFDTIQLMADNSYKAEISSEDLLDEGNVCLFLQEEGGLRLVVFGDKNSKRSVSDVVQIIIQ